MEKYEAFNIETDSIEEWLEGFEAVTEALDIRAEARKIKWIKATIGPVGRGVLQNLGPDATWDQVKGELRRFLGHEDSRSNAWRNLKHYKAENKSLGQVASEVMGHARRAANEVDVQQRLAMEAFLDALPRSIAKELRKSRPTSVPKALDEAKFLMALQDDDEREQLKTLEFQQNNFATRKPEEPEERRYLNQELYQRRNQYQNRSQYQYQSQNRNQRRPNQVTCWACDKEGHLARDCPLWQEWNKERKPKERRQRTAQEDLIQLN